MHSDLPARLRQAAAGPIWDDAHEQVRALLTEAAERVEQLEAPQRAIELATVTGHSLAEIVRLIERLDAMGNAVKPLSQIHIKES